MKVQGEHERLIVSDSRLIINTKWPHLGASPDGIIACECCGKGCLEVKCPFCAKGLSIQDASNVKGSCLIEINGSILLDHNHAYYYQVQAQIFIGEMDYCDFVVWTEKDIYIERIYGDEDFWDDVTIKADKFHSTCILPELLGKWYTRPVRAVVQEDESDGESGPWCYCQEDIEGSQLIGCDNEHCDIVWFHMTCLRIEKAPSGQVLPYMPSRQVRTLRLV